jgi:hypothetical protein
MNIIKSEDGKIKEPVFFTLIFINRGTATLQNRSTKFMYPKLETCGKLETPNTGAGATPTFTTADNLKHHCTEMFLLNRSTRSFDCSTSALVF